jgi:hypothetical protein
MVTLVNEFRVNITPIVIPMARFTINSVKENQIASALVLSWLISFSPVLGSVSGVSSLEAEVFFGISGASSSAFGAKR